jgi:hypothetical protein
MRNRVNRMKRVKQLKLVSRKGLILGLALAGGQ